MFEEIAPKKTGAFRDVFLIIVCGFVLLSLPSWIPGLFNFPYVKAVYEFLVLVGIGLFIFRFLRSYATEYRYVLVDDILTVYGKSGAREMELVRVTLTNQSSLTLWSACSDDIKKEIGSVRKNSFGVSSLASSYLLTFPMQNGRNGLIFQPSEQFVEILQQLLLDKREKM